MSHTLNPRVFTASVITMLLALAWPWHAAAQSSGTTIPPSVSVESGLQHQAVVELYTSEGCNSCPPADRWLNQLSETPRAQLDVLALAFHVDYWDNLGWKDDMAQAAFSARQRQLAHHNGQTNVYTPEFFVNGLETRDRANIVQQIREINTRPSPVHLKLRSYIQRNELQLTLENLNTADSTYSAHLVVFEDGLLNHILRGENRGEYLSHSSVVRYFSRALTLHKLTRINVPIDASWDLANLGIAAIVYEPGEHRPLQSVYTRFRSHTHRPQRQLAE